MHRGHRVPIALGRLVRLADGEWTAASASFAEALAREETPEALEGLSWAAWWLDDAEAVFDARERAYRLYLRAVSFALGGFTREIVRSGMLSPQRTWLVAGGTRRHGRRTLRSPGHPAVVVLPIRVCDQVRES
jgi:hypothetical protein